MGIFPLPLLSLTRRICPLTCIIFGRTTGLLAAVLGRDILSVPYCQKKKGMCSGGKTHKTKFTTWLVALTIQMTRIKCSVPQQELQVLTTTLPVHCHSGSSDLVATSGTLHTYALRFSVDVTWTYPKSCKGEGNDDENNRWNHESRQDCNYQNFSKHNNES